jgi:hypothetical protein
VIPEALYKQVEPLDRIRHRGLHMRALDGWRVAQAMNAVFVTVAEFADVCKEYAIVFVRAGQDAPSGREAVVPVALTGLKQSENLFLRADGHWDARYVPAFVRRYPFALAQADQADAVIVIDAQWSGWCDAASSGSEGTAPAEPLFDAAGELAPVLKKVQAFLDNFRQETLRTGVFADRLLELGLLQPMRFDATLPSGEKLAVDGFLALDAKKFAELPDALLGELHRSGILGMLHLQQMSLGNLYRLVERRVAALPAS